MPDWWSAEAWGILVSGIVGVAGVVVAVVSLFKSGKANRHADDANRIAREANEISRQALWVQERQVEVVISSEQRSRSADLRISRSVMLMQNGQRAKLYIENRGPHDAEDIALTLSQGDSIFDFGRVPRLRTDEQASILQYMGRFLALDESSELEFQLHATFRDGNGNREAQWRVTVAPGERFVDRRWTINKIDETVH